MIVTDIWKNFDTNRPITNSDYGAIVYLAAILGIDTQLYEAAQIDGANRWQQTWHVTLPGMKMIIVLMMVLSLGNAIKCRFLIRFSICTVLLYTRQEISLIRLYTVLAFWMHNMDQQQLWVCLNPFISTLFISVSYFLAYKLADYRIF